MMGLSFGVSDSTLADLIKLISLVSDPEQAKSFLNEIASGLAELKQRQAAAASAEAENVKQLAAFLAVEQKQNAGAADLTARETALAQRELALNVASEAVRVRETEVKARELAVADAEARVARDAEALASKVEHYRNALAG